MGPSLANSRLIMAIPHWFRIIAANLQGYVYSKHACRSLSLLSPCAHHANSTEFIGVFPKHSWALKSKSCSNFQYVQEIIFLYMDRIICVELQRYPVKFHTKHHTHKVKDVSLYRHYILRALRHKNLKMFLKWSPIQAKLIIKANESSHVT